MGDDTLMLLLMSMLVMNLLASCKELRLRKYVSTSIIMPVLCIYYIQLVCELSQMFFYYK